MKCKAALHRLQLTVMLFFCLSLSAVPAPENRRSCAPFVSGDAFRAYADHAYDELTASFNPAEVTTGQTIFIKTDRLEEFFRDVHPYIQYPYIIISHNSDWAAPGSFAPFLEDPRIIAWFAQNYDGTHNPKMHPIPIGIANYMWPHGHVQTIEKVQSKHLSKKYLCYLNIDVNTFQQERWPLYKQLSQASFCHRTRKYDFEKYLSHTALSKFMVSPRGNGLDTHRLWEALYMGSIPIVKTSSLDSLYAELPVLIISDWTQVTESFLENAYEEFKRKNFSKDKISMDYWTRLIDSYKTQ